MYFGFTERLIEGKKVRLAEAEKALIDFLYLDKSFGSASLVFEVLRDHNRYLDLGKLQSYAIRAGITMQRKIGFLLDTLKLEASQVFRAVQKNRGAAHFTAASKKFNAKWRLYYDDRIIG